MTIPSLPRPIRTPVLIIAAMLLTMGLLAVAAARADPAPPVAQAAKPPPALTTEQAAAIKAALEGRLPPGTEIVIETRDGGTRVQDERAEGVGAGARAVGRDVKQDVTGSAPEANLEGRGGAKGGDHDAQQRAFTPASLWSNPLLYAGILCGLAAGACFYPLAIGWRPAAVLGVLSAAFIAAAVVPAVLVWGLAGAGLVAAIAVLASAHHAAGTSSAAAKAIGLVDEAATAAERYKEALRAVVGGVASIEKSDVHTANKVKAAIADQADANDRDVIREVKHEDGLA